MSDDLNQLAAALEQLGIADARIAVTSRHVAARREASAFAANYFAVAATLRAIADRKAGVA